MWTVLAFVNAYAHSSECSPFLRTIDRFIPGPINLFQLIGHRTLNRLTALKSARRATFCESDFNGASKVRTTRWAALSGPSVAFLSVLHERPRKVAWHD
jgi:hypothetical protein